MHVLGFSQGRKSSSKPRDLHIRKVSFSGCSLSSGCSFSSTSSTSTARAFTSDRTGSPSSGHFNPLHLHPTHQPPPRLYERPIIPMEKNNYEATATFFDDYYEEEQEVNGADFLDDNSELDVSEKEVHEEQPSEMQLPPHASPMDHNNDRQEPQDYFLIQLTQRPPMPRSRWSESTVHTLDTLESLDELTPEISHTSSVSETQPAGKTPPNFSYKRATVPQRPPIRAMNSFDNYVKRGGWKRRGIVFNNNEVDSLEETDSGFAI